MLLIEQKGVIPGTTYIRTWYVYAYQHFLFDFPFDEIYRRLYQIRIYWVARGTISDGGVLNNGPPETIRVEEKSVPGADLAVQKSEPCLQAEQSSSALNIR